MRRIFHPSGGSNNSSCSSGTHKPPLKKDAPSKPGLSRKREPEVSTRGATRREHWCPACPSGGDLSCETPPSGDENKGGNNVQVPFTRLGLPECQDKQIVRPSIKSAVRTTTEDRPSSGCSGWTSGLQDALDQLVEESRREPSPSPSPSSAAWKHPPSPTTLSPPMNEKRRRRDNTSSSSSFIPSSASSDQSVNQAVRKNSPSRLPPGISETVHPSKLSRSRSSNSGASILSNPRSQSFSEWSRAPDNFSGRLEFSADDIGRERTQSKYLSARVVAEKLVKVMRGGSKPKEIKRPPVFPQSPTKTRFSPTKSRLPEEHPRFSPTKNRPPESENGFYRRQLDSRSGDVGFIFESLEERVASAEKLFAYAEADSGVAVNGEKNVGKFSSREMERHEGLNRKIKKLQRERKELAHELVSEVRMRNTERVRVREVLGFMKRDMDFCLRALERDKEELQVKLDEAEAGEDDEEFWLRERVKKFAEDKERLEKELLLVTAREGSLRQKVREFEQQMQGHVLRVEGTERTILELRESVAAGQKKLMQSEQECERLRKEMQLERLKSDHREEVSHLRRLLENATEKATRLESQVRDKDKQIGDLHSELRHKSQEVCRYRQEVTSVARQRDEMKVEAEEMGREALRTSAEAEVLRRRVHQLEEDVMLKEGQLAIMSGSLNNEDSL